MHHLVIPNNDLEHSVTDVMYMFGGPGDHVHVCIVLTMLYPLQNGQSLSTRGSHHDAFVERLIHVPDIDGNTKVVCYVCIVNYLNHVY